MSKLRTTKEEAHKLARKLEFRDNICKRCNKEVSYYKVRRAYDNYIVTKKIVFSDVYDCFNCNLTCHKGGFLLPVETDFLKGRALGGKSGFNVFRTNSFPKGKSIPLIWRPSIKCSLNYLLFVVNVSYFINGIVGNIKDVKNALLNPFKRV